MPNNFSALPNGDGSSVELKITQEDGTVAAMSIDPLEIGFVAAGLLGAAVDCAKKTGALYQLAEKIDPSKLQHKHVRSAHGVALAGSEDDPALAVVIFAIGATEFGVAMPRQMLEPLGKSLITFSASGKAN